MSGMRCQRGEVRSDAETAFRLLQRLMHGACVWGASAALLVSDLVVMEHTSKHRVLRALVCLRREGLVSVDSPRGVVRLTPIAIADLAGASRSL